MGCHAREVFAWSSSRHAHAWRDPLFLAAYADEPLPFCRGCHAPLGDPSRTPDAVAQREGITCQGCHASALDHARSAGFLFADGVFPASRRCGACHQFDFPEGAGRPMQDTVREWRASEAAARGDDCASCHHEARTHRLRGLDDRALMERAVDLHTRVTPIARALMVDATLRAHDVGHAVPTGDLHRALRLTVWVDGDEAHAQTRTFTRHFADVARTDANGSLRFERVERWDDRLPAPGSPASRDETRVTFRFARARGTVRWRLVLARTSDTVVHAQGLDRALVDVELSSGVVSPLRPSHPTR